MESNPCGSMPGTTAQMAGSKSERGSGAAAVNRRRTSWRRWNEKAGLPAGCVRLPISDALKVQKETGYEEGYQQKQAADQEQERARNQGGLRVLYRDRFG